MLILCWQFPPPGAAAMTALFPDLPEQAVPPASPGGAPRLRRPDRVQMILTPGSLDDMLPADHQVRLVDAFVARLDLGPLRDAIKSREGTPGHPAVDPAVLVTLWLYATVDGVGSARELARLCELSLPYQWICGGVSLNHHTLSDARLAYAAWLDDTLTASLAALLSAGAIKLETVAQDGLRVRASAGAGSFRRRPTLERCLTEAEARVATLKVELGDDTGASRRRGEAARARAAAERLARLKAAVAALPEAEKRAVRNKKKAEQARVSTTDPEASVMKMPDGGFRPAYNTQLAAETEHGLIVGLDVTASGADQPSLEPMVEQVAERSGQTPDNWLADGGFFNKDTATALAADGITLYCPPHKPKGDRAPGEAMENDTPAVAALRERMASETGQTVYRQRARWIEWVNAGFRQRDWRQVPVRGLAKVRILVRWQALTHNMTRIMRTPGLIAAFPSRLSLA
jgi:transposase